MSKYPEYQHTKSRAWFDRALQVIPSGVYGHLGPSEGLFLPLEKWPLLSSKAKGAYFWDLDGNPYLDLMCAYGPNVLGYGDPDVDRAAMEQLMAGNCTTAPSYKMVECAELLHRQARGSRLPNPGYAILEANLRKTEDNPWRSGCRWSRK